MTAPIKFDRCSSCHVNVHRESVKDDCRSCHTETTFTGAPFDHAVKTGFALDGKHEGLECRKCHTGGLARTRFRSCARSSTIAARSAECVACHGEKDPHKGEFGRACESCHRPTTFSAPRTSNTRAQPDFFAGQHAHGHVRAVPRAWEAPQPVPTGALSSASPRTRRHPRQRPAPPPRARRRPRWRARRATRMCTSARWAWPASVVTRWTAQVRGGQVLARQQPLSAHGQASGNRVREVPPDRDARVSVRHGRGRPVQSGRRPVPGVPQGPAPRPGGRAVRNLPPDRDVRVGVVRSQGDGRLLRRLPQPIRLQGLPQAGEPRSTRPAAGTAFRFLVGRTCADCHRGF